MTGLIEALREKLSEVVVAEGLLDREVVVRAEILTPEQAIGHPGSDEFPLARGKERLVEAELEGCKGQAYTGRPMEFRGTLRDVLSFDLSHLGQRGVFVAVSNAVVRRLGLAESTVHCRDQTPWRCAEELSSSLDARRVALIGYQPAMLRALARNFQVRATDMNPKNIGRVVEGVRIEPHERNEEVIEWADIALITGSVVANGTMEELLQLNLDKLMLYGVTGASAEALLGIKRWCISNL